MIIEKNTIAGIHYRMKDIGGDVIDSNEDYSPLQYLHGHNNILPALEDALQGLAVNDEKEVVLNPIQAYGNYDPSLIIKIDKEQLVQEVEELQQGAIIANADGKEFVILSVDDKTVTLDGNHPLADKTLKFHVKVVSLHAATPQEIMQGRPLTESESSCGPGCCC